MRSSATAPRITILCLVNNYRVAVPFRLDALRVKTPSTHSSRRVQRSLDSPVAMRYRIAQVATGPDQLGC